MPIFLLENTLAYEPYKSLQLSYLGGKEARIYLVQYMYIVISDFFIRKKTLAFEGLHNLTYTETLYPLSYNSLCVQHVVEFGISILSSPDQDF